jgi:predicted nucleotidyltransferase component of viral defense system
MITRKELEEFARLKGLTIGNAEKDYLLDLILFSLSQHSKNELVFKGGTCLSKFYHLNRFSEDLDFSAILPVRIDPLIEQVVADLKKFGLVAWMHQKKEPFNSILITLRIQGPLFTGNPLSYARVGVDINLKSSVFLPPRLLSHRPIYPEIPATLVLCLAQEEIFAEKIRALLTRKKARDLYDLYFLLQSGISAPPELIVKKMEYYQSSFDLIMLLQRIKDLQQSWDREMKGLLAEVPEFKSVLSVTSAQLQEKYRRV